MNTMPLSELANYSHGMVRHVHLNIVKNRTSTAAIDALPWEVRLYQMMHGPNAVTVVDENKWHRARIKDDYMNPGAMYYKLRDRFGADAVNAVLGPEFQGQPILEQLIRENIRPLDAEGNEIMLNQPAPGPADTSAPPARPQINEVDAAPAPSLNLPDVLDADRNGYIKKDEAMLILERLGVDVDNSMTADDVRATLAESLDAEIAERGGELVADEKLPAKFARLRNMLNEE